MSRPVIRDPFYRQILKALEEAPISPEAFERCAVDLLRPEIPGIALVPGGSDGGFDGAIPSIEGGGWLPLVATTGDGERNLRENLDTVRRLRPAVRSVVFATTRGLGSTKRERLEGIALERGFQLYQIFGAEDFALRLYHRSEWCRELLNLGGQPSALSVIPVTRRPLLDLEPVGRDKDIDWLLAAKEPRLLVGSPGSGKTFLLRHLMLRRNWNALFLVRHGAGDAEIANAVRDLRPGIVVVDDAHEDPGRIPSLVQLLRGIDSAVQIVAST
jgi:hypothetical protein